MSETTSSAQTRWSASATTAGCGDRAVIEPTTSATASAYGNSGVSSSACVTARFKAAASSADRRHRARRAFEATGADRVAGPLAADGRGYRRSDVCVRFAVAQHRPQVELVEREQTRSELTVGRDADAVARLAERLG